MSRKFENYGNEVSKLRLMLVKRGITQKELSELSGVAYYTISNLCTGKKTNIHLDNAKKIANCLGVTLNDLFGDYE